jgi:arylsulfatase A-like enzyme
VTPFAPMNALLKLADANGYRIAVSFDSIMSELLPRAPGLIELGAESWTARDDACRVLSEMEQLLDGPGGTAAPLFAYSLPQNVHIGNVQGHPISGESYPGFYSLLAATVRHVDGCVGRFVEQLKARGLYDDSVIIITADHGDSVGEGGRWGHGFAGFPEVVRIPLIVHLPRRFTARWSADLDGVSFSTDIVPTLYNLLEQDVTLRGPTFGMSLVYPRDTDPPADRRRGAFLLAASYGPVYGMLQRNGESYYVVDAVNSRDYAFDLAGGPPHATPVPVTPAQRLAGQRLIREQIEQVAAFFHFDAQPMR